MVVPGITNGFQYCKRNNGGSNEGITYTVWENLDLKDGSISDHLNEFNTVTSQLSSIKVNFADEVSALLILGSLPKNWNGLVMVVSHHFYFKHFLHLTMLLVLSLTRKYHKKAQVRHQVNVLSLDYWEKGMTEGERQEPRQLWQI